jgi:heptosyltransferase-2
MAQTTAPSTRRIVVRPPNWLGDAIMALPAIAAIRRHFAADHLTIAAVPAVAAIFREDTDVAPDRVINLATENRAAIAMLEGEGFDLGILFPNSFRSAWQMWRGGVAERWGIARSARGLLLTRRSAPPSRRQGVRHQSDVYRALVTGLGIPCSADTMPRLAPRMPSVERAGALLAAHGVAPDARLIGFAPGAAYGRAKQWLPERAAELAVRLIRHQGTTCVLVGASHDRDAARAIESWVRAHAPDAMRRIVNLTGHTSLSALVGLVARMTAFVSNDSGSMHLAAALGRPVVAVFGPTDERVTRPLGDHTVISAPVFCRPCLLRECPIDHRCMKRVGVDEVYEAVLARLPGEMRQP